MSDANDKPKPECPVCSQMGWDCNDVHPPKKPSLMQRLWREFANSKAVEQVGEAIGEAADRR